jgi:hypothetical protein
LGGFGSGIPRAEWKIWRGPSGGGIFSKESLLTGATSITASPDFSSDEYCGIGVVVARGGPVG